MIIFLCLRQNMCTTCALYCMKLWWHQICLLEVCVRFWLGNLLSCPHFAAIHFGSLILWQIQTHNSNDRGCCLVSFLDFITSIVLIVTTSTQRLLTFFWISYLKVSKQTLIRKISNISAVITIFLWCYGVRGVLKTRLLPTFTQSIRRYKRKMPMLLNCSTSQSHWPKR